MHLLVVLLYTVICLIEGLPQPNSLFFMRICAWLYVLDLEISWARVCS